MIEVYALFSGSSGNSIYVRSGDTELLFDAGRSATMTERSLNRLGTSLKNIKSIFVTHEHSDHTYGLEVISKRFGIPVHFTYPSYKAYVKEGTFLSRHAVAHDVIYCETVGDVSIKSFKIPHDAKQNVGYIISSGNESFGIATDMGHVTDEIVSSLSACEKVIVESNHDIDMLMYGIYPQYLKDRILSNNGHLSNDDCANLVCTLAKNGVRSFTLAHLSAENNFPDIALDKTKKALIHDGIDISGIKLNVASPIDTVCATS